MIFAIKVGRFCPVPFCGLRTYKKLINIPFQQVDTDIAAVVDIEAPFDSMSNRRQALRSQTDNSFQKEGCIRAHE